VIRRVSELKLTDGDDVSIALRDSEHGLSLAIEAAGKESPEVCLLPYQRRQFVSFLLDCDMADEVTA